MALRLNLCIRIQKLKCISYSLVIYTWTSKACLHLIIFCQVQYDWFNCTKQELLTKILTNLLHYNMIGCSLNHQRLTLLLQVSLVTNYTLAARPTISNLLPWQCQYSTSQLIAIANVLHHNLLQTVLPYIRLPFLEDSLPHEVDLSSLWSTVRG